MPYYFLGFRAWPQRAALQESDGKLLQESRGRPTLRTSTADDYLFPTSPDPAYADAMRCPEPIDLGQALLLLLLVIPMGYFVVQLVFALLS